MIPGTSSARTPPPGAVLVVRLGAIGDVVNALVFATALRDARPDVRIGWVVHELARPLVADHPSVDTVHTWRRGGGPREVLRLLRELRAARYDLAVDLQRLQKSSLLARLSGAPRVLGYDRARAKEGSWIWTRERVAPGSASAHMAEQYLEFARHLGVDATRPRHVLPQDARAARWADALVSELGAPPVLLNLGATKPANRWAPERFGELAARLGQRGDAPVCLTGAPSDRVLAERALAAASGSPEGPAAPRSLVGETDLRQLVELTRRARLFVGCDTGPMHVAAACGTPVVALFGPADPRRTGPWGGATVLRELPPCAPCNRRTCDQPRHACMEDLTVERVFGEVSRLLDASRGSAATDAGPA